MIRRLVRERGPYVEFLMPLSVYRWYEVRPRGTGSSSRRHRAGRHCRPHCHRGSLSTVSAGLKVSFGDKLCAVTALTEIPQFCSPKFPTPGRFSLDRLYDRANAVFGGQKWLDRIPSFFVADEDPLVFSDFRGNDDRSQELLTTHAVGDAGIAFVVMPLFRGGVAFNHKRSCQNGDTCQFSETRSRPESTEPEVAKVVKTRLFRIALQARRVSIARTPAGYFARNSPANAEPARQGYLALSAETKTTCGQSS